MTARQGEVGELLDRARVVAAARAWIGTPYHHTADVKGAGVDCAMLLVRVYCDLGLVEPFDPRPYTRDWMLHRDEERYLGFLLARATLVEQAGAGDVDPVPIGRCFAHGGIVTKAEPLTIIHAFTPARLRPRGRGRALGRTRPSGCGRPNSRAIGA